MKILVAGAGAVGTLYGAKLSQAGAEVSLLCRSSYDAIKKDGATINSIWGDFAFHPAGVFKDAGEFQAENGRADIILVAYKVLPEIDVPALINAAVGPETTIFLLQNGVNIEEPIKYNFPDNRIISGLAFTCISRPSPCVVNHTDYGNLTIGIYPCGIDKKCQELADLFTKSGVSIKLSDNIEQDRWSKLIWNAPFNPMSVLAGGCKTNELLADPTSETVIREAMHEVLALARNLDYELSSDLIHQNIEKTKRMKPYYTSMCLDWQEGRPMEVEAILGNAITLADKASIPVPTLRTLYSLLLQIDKKLRNNLS